MKKTTILLLFACVFGGMQGVAQTIRRVTNNPAVTGVNIYATAQAAHDASVNDDIIYLDAPIQSNPDYGSLFVSKRLTIIGNGYLLSQNPNTPFDKLIPQISQLQFTQGSAYSKISGVRVASSTLVADSNITISRCQIYGASLALSGSPASRGNYINFKNCLMEGGINGYSNQAGIGCLISNNLFINGGSQVILSSLTNSTFIHNTFIPYQYSQYGGQISNVTNSVFSNNIFDWRNYIYGLATLINNSAGTIFSNNVSVGYSGLPVGNGNINNASVTNFYANSDPLTNYSTLGESVFQPGSGAVGTNMGAFSGSNPYILSGLPAIPIITNFITSGLGNTSTPLNVSVTVRGNN